MKHLLIDFSLIAHASLFTTKEQLNHGGYDLLKHILYRSILASISQFKPDRVWVCYDGGSSWRKEFSSSYKANRKEVREKQSVEGGGDIDWVAFYKVLDEMQKDMREHFPFWVIRANSIEADDIIAHIVKTSSPQDENIIITRDGDYVQLLYYPNTRIYNPIDRKYITCENAIFALQQKICMGDKSDNILPIRPRFGEKTAEKFILAGELDKLLEQAQKDIKEFGKPKDPLAEAYFKNRKLIDMSQIPPTLTKIIEDTIATYKVSDGKGLFKYFITNGLREMTEDISRVRSVMAGLT